MKEVNVIEHGDIFDISPAIVVQNEIHHGKVLLHSHTFYEFVYVEKGFSLHSFNGKMTILTSGDLFAICPNNAHSYFSAYQANIYNCLFDIKELAGLEDSILKLPGMEFILNNAEFPLVKVDLASRRDLILLLEKIKWERANKAAGWELALKSYLIQFLITFSRFCGNNTRKADGDPDEYFGYVYKALEFIEKNYDKDISSQDIAGYVGLSAGYLVKQFKNRLSMTPAGYLRNFRIAKAMEYIKTTDMTITEIANLVGFGDLSLFSRIFKQTTGKSPVGFKKNDKE